MIIPTRIALLGMMLLLSACDPVTPQTNSNRVAYQPFGTVREAYTALQPTIRETLSGQVARLVSVQSRFVGADGTSKYWTFKYVVDAKVKTDAVTIYEFTWSQGTIQQRMETLSPKTYDSPENDYLRRDIGSTWADSPGLTGLIYTENPGLSKIGLSMDLVWNTKISTAHAVWTVSQGKANIPVYYFNAATGEKISTAN